MIKFDVEDVFDPDDYLYFYDIALTPERLQKEIDFLVKCTSLESPKKVLDLSCGHGRHANALAEKGHDVTGIDITKGFLDLARKSADKIGVTVDYIYGDMRKINYSEEFDRVYSLFTAIGYFNEEENAQVFQNIYNALKPGGMFCFDSHNRDVFLTYHLPSHVHEKEGNLLVDQCSYDTITGRSTTKRMIVREDRIKKCEFSVRFYNPTEIIQLFEKIGFSTCSFYGSWDGTAVNKDSRRLIVVAKK